MTKEKAVSQIKAWLREKVIVKDDLGVYLKAAKANAVNSNDDKDKDNN